MKENRNKIFSVLTLIVIGVMAISGIAFADSVPVTIEKVKLDGEEITEGEIRGQIIRGNQLDIEVKFEATADDDYIVVHAEIDGLDHDQDEAEAETDPFSVREGKTYIKSLRLNLPDRIDLDEGDEFQIRVWISNRKDDTVEFNGGIQLNIDSSRNQVDIKDIVFDPEGSVRAGYAMYTTVRVKNMGKFDEDSVKVRLNIPELGVSQTAYIDNLESEDTKKSEPLYVRIPECAEPGQYVATVSVTYDEGDEVAKEERLVNVVASDACTTAGTGKTVVAVSSETQDVTAGASGVVYPLTLSNTGSSSRTYVISTANGDWANVRVSPSVVVLGAGETKIAYVYVTAKETATEGLQTFSVAIKSGEETLKEITLSANVIAVEETEETGNSLADRLKSGATIALIVLFALLIIIGLIIGFSKLKGNDDEDESEDNQTYY